VNESENTNFSPAAIAALHNATVTYDGYLTRALANVSFEVRRGEIFGLLGPSGCGKSTILRMLVGRLQPTEGTVKVFGRSPRRASTKARIGYFPDQTTRERELYFAGLPGLWRKMIGRQSPLGKTSKEARLRSGLAQALSKKPDLVLLDEPFADLDAKSRDEMKELVLSLVQRGKTVVLTADSLLDVTSVCHRMAVLFDGKIQITGTLDELLASPDAIRFTAPLLPKATTERLLKIIREDVCSQNPEQPLRISPAENPMEKILTSLTNATESKPSSPSADNSADQVNHDKLAQLTRPSK
jgi:ABC-2 type transport system ATP-binding protein